MCWGGGGGALWLIVGRLFRGICSDEGLDSYLIAGGIKLCS